MTYQLNDLCLILVTTIIGWKRCAISNHTRWTEPEEKIVNIKNVTGSRALNMLYDTLTNRYVFKLTVDGEEVELTRGELMVHVRSPRTQFEGGSLSGVVPDLCPGWTCIRPDVSDVGERLAQRNKWI